MNDLALAMFREKQTWADHFDTVCNKISRRKAVAHACVTLRLAI